MIVGEIEGNLDTFDEDGCNVGKLDGNSVSNMEGL